MGEGEILDLVDAVKARGLFEELRKRTCRGKGMETMPAGRVLVPSTKHYSWVKAMDILGLGQDKLVQIKVDSSFRMDMADLRKCLERCLRDEIPALAVVAVIGSTEEGAIDPLHEMAELRREFAKKGLSFHLHADCAFGGYARSLFLEPGGAFMNYAGLKKALFERGIFSSRQDWPSRSVYEAFKAIPEADSITIDPHKLGYVPYAAGAAVFKDKRALDLISYFAAYVFEETEDNPMLLGSYIMKGSKAGSAAAAVWMAHKVVSLDIDGYGGIIGRSVEGARRFYNALLSARAFSIDGRDFQVMPICEPDLNMVDFCFYPKGSLDLEEINALNLAVYERCSWKGGPLYAGDFITSKTSLDFSEYGDTPMVLLSSLGIPEAGGRRVGSLYVLRSCVLTPYLARDESFEAYWSGFLSAMGRALTKARA